MILHPGLREALEALLHAIGEDGRHAQHLGPGVAQDLHDLEDAAAGRDQILYDDDLLPREKLPLDLVFPPVVLRTGANIAHR